MSQNLAENKVNEFNLIVQWRTTHTHLEPKQPIIISESNPIINPSKLHTGILKPNHMWVHRENFAKNMWNKSTGKQPTVSI